MKAANKTQVVAKTTQIYTNKAIEQLEALSGERDVWEKTLYQTATEALYGLLGKVYGFYDESFIKRNPQERLALRQEIASKLTQSGVRVQSNSSVLGLLIRYVFKSDRKRVLCYQKAVEIAKKFNVKPTELAGWLRNNHGIDGVTHLTKESKDKEAKRQELEATVAQLNAVIDQRQNNPMASLTITGFQSQKISALITQPGLNGEFKIVCVVEGIETGVYNSLVRSAARTWKAANEDMSQLNAEAEKFILSADELELKAA
jgi:hypothetical protein